MELEADSCDVTSRQCAYNAAVDEERRNPHVLVAKKDVLWAIVGVALSLREGVGWMVVMGVLRS